MHRFFLQQGPSGGQFSVDDIPLIHQWKNVFRFTSGDRVVLFPGDGREYVARLDSLDKKRAVLTIEEERPALMQQVPLSIFSALIKKDNLEWVFQKGTEIGITRFAPILTARSEKKSFNFERGKKIITEAAEQSGWGAVPVLDEQRTLAEVVSSTVGLVAFDASGEILTEGVVQQIRGSSGILIGPEGGFSPEELALFNKNDISVYSLGKQTLRAETAAIAIAAKILL